jgi:hypothetical protein
MELFLRTSFVEAFLSIARFHHRGHEAQGEHSRGVVIRFIAGIPPKASRFGGPEHAAKRQHFLVLLPAFAEDRPCPRCEGS